MPTDYAPVGSTISTPGFSGQDFVKVSRFSGRKLFCCFFPIFFDGKSQKPSKNTIFLESSIFKWFLGFEIDEGKRLKIFFFLKSELFFWGKTKLLSAWGDAPLTRASFSKTIHIDYVKSVARAIMCNFKPFQQILSPVIEKVLSISFSSTNK